MAANPEEPKKPKRAKVKPRPLRPDDVGSVSDAVAATDDAFYKESIAELGQLTSDHQVLLNIPVWGYPGHGKTSSILTAIHYCLPHIHGASFALVTDADDLIPVAERYPQFRADDLRVAAETTRDFLGDLKGWLFRDNEWPYATEQPAQYLLELQTVAGTLGYAILPDLRGGSYEASDDISKNALGNAHAMVLLVEPSDFVNEDDPRSADYKKEILRRIQRCARDSIPTCVMITMADEYTKSGDALDKTVKELTRLLAGQPEAFKAISQLRRVSAVGMLEGDFSVKPPEAKKRKPDELLKAWIWTLRQALARPREDIRMRPPKMNLRADVRSPQVVAPSVPTLRQISAPQKSPGVVVASLNESESDTDLYLFLDPTGKLLEVRLNRESCDIEIVRELEADGTIDGDWVVRVAGSTIVVGASSAATFLFYGARGQQLLRTSLPSVLQSWALVETKRLVGISEDGTIHLLSLQGTTWADTHHLQQFFTPSGEATCGYVTASRMAVVATGVDVVGVDVSTKGKFGDVRKPAIAARFDDNDFAINAEGYFAACLNDNSIVGGREKQASLGPGHPEWTPVFALCNAAPFVAWVTPTARLRAASLAGKSHVLTPEEPAPKLDTQPTGLCWSSKGDIVAVTTDDGNLVCFSRHGF